MVLRKILSCPEIALMVNNKKQDQISSSTLNNILLFNNNDNNDNNDNKKPLNTKSLKKPLNKKPLNNEKSKVIRLSYGNIRLIKENLRNLNDVLIDYINTTNHYSLEESTIYSAIIIYLADYILKRERLKDLFKYIVQLFIRYAFMYYIHTQIIHDKLNIDINLPLLSLHIGSM